MAAVSVAGVSKVYGSVHALDDVTIEFRNGEFFALLGPSGSGKTTLLRCIAGFIPPDAGSIRFDGQAVERIPVHKRDIGMVFQHYALFPHMSVFDNIAFGLEVRGQPRNVIRERVMSIVELVRLTGLERRKPRQLSGGQQQRVALARALVTRPRVLLLDEPLGALDKRLRQAMQIELKQIQREVGLTTVFVTHDQEEALTLSDRIAIIDHGGVVQIGAPHEIYDHPKTAFAASFLGDANFFKGRVGTSLAGRTAVHVDDDLVIYTEHTVAGQRGATMLAVRPEKIRLLSDAEAEPSLCNRLPGKVVQAIYAGSSTTYIVESRGRRLTAFEQNRTAPLKPGAEVTVAWAARHSVMVEP